MSARGILSPSQALRLPTVLAAAVLAVPLALSACDGTIRHGVDAGIASGTARAEAQAARLAAAQRGHVIVEATPYFGRQVEAKTGSRQGKPLPKKLEGAKGIDIAIDGRADIRTIAGAIEAATDIPVSVRTRYIVGDAVIEVPIGTTMTARHKGPLSAFLDRIAARMDVAWSHDGRSISIDRMVRREWRVPLPRGKTTLSDTIGGEGISIATERAIDHWAELETRLAPLAPPPARVLLSREAGRVSVFGPPSVQRSVAKVLDDVVATASQRIALEVGVYFVDSDKAEEFGVSLNSRGANLGTIDGKALTAVAAIAGAGLAGAGGTLTLSRGAGSISFETLARDAAVVDYRIGSTIAQSGVVAPISLTRTQSYNRQAQTVTTETNTTGGTETQEFETGIIIAALPTLIERSRLQLGLAITQRDLVRIDANGFPVIDERAIRSEAVLAAGETLVVTGYEQQRTRRQERGVGILRKVGIGGRNAGEQRRVRMYVLIRPSVLPRGRRS